MTRRFRCSEASEGRTESLVGSASTVTSFLLVEAPGSWGLDAIRDNRLPTEVKTGLARAANRAGVRLLFIRRHGRRRSQAITVFAAHAAPTHPWLETGSLDDPAELLGLDLASLGAGRSPGLTPHDAPLFLVCTHGKHDVCCAERGRPLANALHQVLPSDTWEVSHIGGDRFAGNVLVLPDGLYYGRLSPEAAVDLAHRHTAGHLDLAHLRGRSAYPFAVQAAEIFVRGELGRTELAALTLVRSERQGDTTAAVFTDGTRSWDVCVETERSGGVRLTCQADADGQALAHRLVSLTPR